MTSSTGDRKLVRTTTGAKEERLVVLINENLHYKNSKHLGIPPKTDEAQKPSSIGYTQFQYAKIFVMSWKAKGTTRPVLYDNTASFTWIILGVVIRIEVNLNRKVLGGSVGITYTNCFRVLYGAYSLLVIRNLKHTQLSCCQDQVRTGY